MAERSRHKRGPSVYDYGQGYGVYMFNELRESSAYRVLTFAEKAILVDMYRVFSIATKSNRRGIDGVGFFYTYSHCKEFVSAKTFYPAVGRICAVGFFKRAPELERMKSGSPNVYLPSAAWRKYKTTDEEARTLQRFDKTKAQKIERDSTRRRDLNSRLARPSGTKPNGRNFSDNYGKKLPGQHPPEHSTIGSNFPDNTPENDPDYGKKLPGLSNNHTLHSQEVDQDADQRGSEALRSGTGEAR